MDELNKAGHEERFEEERVSVHTIIIIFTGYCVLVAITLLTKNTINSLLIY